LLGNDRDGDDHLELLGQGRAMRDALVEDLARIEDIAVTYACADASGHLPDGTSATPVSPLPGESPFEFVHQQALAHDLSWVVAPEGDGLLACLRKIVGKQRWIGCDSASIRLASSKSATLEELSRHGIATPVDFFGRPEVTRWVVKPDDGAGAVHTQLFGGLDTALLELARRRHANAPATLEPWVEGEAMSLSLLCDGSGGAEVLSVNRQDIRVEEGGGVHYEGVSVGALKADDPRVAALHQLARQVAAAIPGLRGFAGIDLVWHAQRGPVVIEVNPRVTCAYVGLSAALHRPQLAAEVLAKFDNAHSREPAGVA
jgi:predicted ATP-grasp superfamily ATP-dependent carboligase